MTLDNGFRSQEMTSNTQAMEDLKEQMRLAKLEANCDQVRITCFNQNPNRKNKKSYLVYTSGCNEGCTVCSASQDLLFASQLARQSQVSAEVLLETLRLLLPVLPESELLSITDALCSKHHQDPTVAEQEQSE